MLIQFVIKAVMLGHNAVSVMHDRLTGDPCGRVTVCNIISKLRVLRSLLVAATLAHEAICLNIV